MAKKFQSKNIILTKKLNNVVYELMVKTNSDMVYVEDQKTLTEKLYDITELLTNYGGKYEELYDAYTEILDGAPETFRTFKEIWDYLNINGDPKSELIKLIESKQTAEEGKGLSTHDFDDIMYEKLKNNYTKEELDEKFEIVIDHTNKTIEALKEDISKKIDDINNRPNILIAESHDEISIPDYSCWYHIVSKDII